MLNAGAGNVKLHFLCSHILSCHGFLKYSTAIQNGSELRRRKKKILWGFLFSSATLFPISRSPSAYSSFSCLSPLSPSIPQFLFSPHHCLLLSLPPGIFLLYSFHPSASESLMRAMSWSVWMWAAFRMIIPSYCVHLISHLLLHSGSKLLTSNTAYHQIFTKALELT